MHNVTEWDAEESQNLFIAPSVDNAETVEFEDTGRIRAIFRVGKPGVRKDRSFISSVKR